MYSNSNIGPNTDQYHFLKGNPVETLYILTGVCSWQRGGACFRPRRGQCRGHQGPHRSSSAPRLRTASRKRPVEVSRLFRLLTAVARAETQRSVDKLSL
ncbi:hypothetical protein BKA93DRAFT_478912 [Sparassis latifolia]